MRKFSVFDRLTNLEWVLLSLIFLFGVFLRVLAQDHLRAISPDGMAYIAHATSFLEGEGNIERRGPLFQLLLMATYKLAGQVTYESSVFVPQFFGCIIPLLFFLLGKRVFGTKAGLVAALLASLNPMLINLSSWVLRETFSLALILTMILTSYSALGMESKKRNLITVLSGFFSGLIILTREEMLFIIPPAYVAYEFFNEKRRRDFLLRTCIFLVATLLTITPWLLYSSSHFGHPFYSYIYYTEDITGEFGLAQGTEASSSSTSAFQKILSSAIRGFQKEMIALPAVFSLFGFLFLPVGVVFSIKRRAIWIVYFIVGLDLLILAPMLHFVPYELVLFPYSWVDVDRIIFPGVMSANIFVAYGIVKLLSLLSTKEI